MTAVLRVEEGSSRYLVEVEPTLTRAFELLATAKDGVPRLRGLLLSLAAQGKLVPQDASDEPADVMLARIRTEKSSPAVNDRTKPAKYLRAPSNSDEPFAIPTSWVWARLGEITTFGECDKASDIADTTWVLDLEDIEKSTGRIVRRVTFAERRSLSDKNVFRAQDVLYGKLRPYLNKVAVADADGVCTTEILPFRGYGDIDPHYLRTVIQSPYFLGYVNAKSYGMKMPRLGTDDGRNAWISLPPLAEQHRIVARVEELMKLCDALEQNGRLADEQHARLTSTLFDALAASESAQALAENWQRVAEHFDVLLDRSQAIDALEQTILRLAFDGILVVPDTPAMDAPFVPSGSVVDYLNGYAFKSEWFRPRGTRLARNLNVGHGSLQWREAACVDDGIAAELSRFSLRAGDILISLDRPIISTGLKYAEVSPHDLPCLLLQRVARLQPDGTRLLPRYLLLWLNSPQFMGAIDPGRSNGVPHISTRQLQSIALRLPSLAEQRRIVAHVEELRRLCGDLRQRLTRARETQSRLADALVADVA